MFSFGYLQDVDPFICFIFFNQVPFFNDDEETPSTPKADALFVPRENPRALVIRPLEQWHSISSAEKTKATGTPVHENGKTNIFIS